MLNHHSIIHLITSLTLTLLSVHLTLSSEINLNSMMLLHEQIMFV